MDSKVKTLVIAGISVLLLLGGNGGVSAQQPTIVVTGADVQEQPVSSPVGFVAPGTAIRTIIKAARSTLKVFMASQPPGSPNTLEPGRRTIIKSAQSVTRVFLALRPGDPFDTLEPARRIRVTAAASLQRVPLIPSGMPPPPPPPPPGLPGIDVSHHQGTISWSQVQSDGNQFTFVKATEGVGFTDSEFQTNMNGGKAANVLAGAYHFGRPDLGNDAASEAQFFVSVAGTYISDGFLRPVLDLECGGEAASFCTGGTILSKAELSQWVNTWMSTVKNATGVAPLIYVNSNYANNYLDISIAQYDLWIAHWTHDPLVPPNTGIWADWAFWQYSDLGNVPGITGNVDLNLFNGSESELQRFMVTPTRAALANRFRPILFLHDNEVYEPDAIEVMVREDTELWRRNLLLDDFIQEGVDRKDLFANWEDPALYLDLAPSSAAIAKDYENSYIPLRDTVDTAYARVIVQPGPQVIIQYWFFYYFQNWNLNVNHEGDWEVVQLVFKSGEGLDTILLNNLKPEYVLYSAHEYGFFAFWDEVSKEDSRPEVFVADGSHANYVKGGCYSTSLGGRQFLPWYDHAPEFKSRRIDPEVEVIPENAAQAISGTPQQWVRFSGNWGSTFSSLFRKSLSPPSPRQQEKWTDPMGWGKSLLFPWPPVPCAGFTLSKGSQVDIHVYDPSGLHVGRRADGGIDLEIQGSEFIEVSETDVDIISIPGGDVSDGYRVVIEGTGSGNFDLALTIQDAGQSTIRSVLYDDFNVTPDMEAEIELVAGTSFSLHVDTNGDGTFDQILAPTKSETSTLNKNAESTLTLQQNSEDGATGLVGKITKVVDPATGNDASLLLDHFQAQTTYDSSCVILQSIREMDFPISGIDVDNPGGITIFDGTSAEGIAYPVGLGHALTRLTGNAGQQCQIDFDVVSLVDSAGAPLAVTPPVSQIVQRGDARVDGVVNIADALFIAQYLVGSRDACTTVVDTTCLHSVNAASVRQDSAFDMTTIADALFIAQYLVGLRDEFYNLGP